MKLKLLGLFFILLASQLSCTFLKNENDHQRFVEEKLLKLFRQKSIFQPSNKSDLDYQNYEHRKFIEAINTRRTNNGTFLTTVSLFETYYNTESCQIPYPGMPGYVYKDRYGSRLVSILKRPAGVMNIRTDYDGDIIYLINIDNAEEPQDVEQKNKWSTLFTLDLPCR